MLRFGLAAAAGTPRGEGAEYFERLVEARTGGRVKVEVSRDSRLRDGRDELAALRSGAVQVLAPPLAELAALGVRDFEAFDLPYLFESYAELHKVTDGPLGASFLEKLEPKGIVGLAYWDDGFKVVTADTPLRKPADFRGLRMRVRPSKVLDGEMRALGAIPRVMASSEVYPALKTRLLDGTEDTPSRLYARKTFEVQKYVTLSDHGYLGYAVIVNKRFWDALPPDIRRTLGQCMKEATEYVNHIAIRDNHDALQAMRSRGKPEIIELTPDEKREWKKVLLKVHRQNEPRIGRDVIESIYREIGFDPDGP